MADYHDQLKKTEILKLRELQKELPPFLKEFFVGISHRTSPKTATAYAYDLGVFFRFIYEEHRILGGIPSIELTLSNLDDITVTDMEEFLNYLSFYIKLDNKNTNNNGTENNGAENKKREHSPEVSNENRSKARKLSAIRTVYKYFLKKEKIKTNPPSLIDMPKITDKAIVKLEVNEIGDFLDAVESGNKLTPHQKTHHKRTQKRDLALITLMLGTGLRISECIGINLEHIDFDINGVSVTRKGGDTAIIYFGEEVQEALEDYIKERKELIPKDENETALFLSTHGYRISARQVQILVKKYSQGVTIKKITPHKLRSTFGTNLYRETGDIYLVANALGHSNVNTTHKHYVDMQEENRKKVVTHTKLRKN